MIWDNVALACPYYRSEGKCETGCRTEPECMTLTPPGGWRPRDERGRFTTLAEFYVRLDGGS